MEIRGYPYHPCLYSLRQRRSPQKGKCRICCCQLYESFVSFHYSAEDEQLLWMARWMWWYSACGCTYARNWSWHFLLFYANHKIILFVLAPVQCHTATLYAAG